MGRWSLAALGLAALVAVGLLLWELQRGPAPSGSRAVAARAQSSEPGPVEPPVEPDEGFEPAPARRLRHVPTVEEVGHDRMQLLLSGDVPQRLMRAAAGCYGGEAGDTERMKIAYTLHFDQGRATIEDVEMISSDLGSPDLEQCVVSTLGELTWTDGAAPNLLRDMEIELSLLDLRSRKPRDERADDAPDENEQDE